MGQAVRERADKVEVRHLACKILLVDEDVQDLSNHAKLIEAEGFEAVKCGSYEAAIRSIEKEDFDLAMVDQGSPAFEGLVVLRYLKRFNCSTPFVVLARFADMKCYLQALELGAVDYLLKPISAEQMNWVYQTCFGTSPVTIPGKDL
jgi:DNA-binding NtrC family response regulator